MRHQRARGAVFLFLAVTWVVATAARDAVAQTVNPTTAEFNPSADHNTTAVTRYDLEFYLPGAASPFQINSLGKPTPDTDGVIRVVLSSVLTAFPAPGIVYEAKAAAVGPGGVGRSAASNTFSFTAGCTYSIAPTSQAVAAGGAPGNATVSTGGNCPWTAASNAAWLSVTSGATGSGNGTVGYSATANATASSRTGTLTIAGQTLTVTQVACGYTISPTTQSIAAGGAAANATVTTTSGCPWTATSNATGLYLSSGGSGSGNGTVNYSAAANTTTSSRTGTLTIAGRTLSVTQVACGYTVSPTTQNTAAAGGPASATVSTTSGCPWTATSNAAWLSISSGGSGSGNGTVNYAVAANTTTSSRNGTLTIGGQTLTVSQAGCSYTISPTTESSPAAGEAATATVSTTSSCPWTATSNAPWLSITNGGSGTGNGTVNYSVAANLTTSTRTGTLTIGGQTLTVTEVACSYTVSPTTQTIAADGGTANATVSTTSGCPWTALSNDAWLSITSSGSGSDSATVNYSISANTTSSSRTGTLTIAGKTVTVTQAPGLSAPSGVYVDRPQ
jgi:hypothetical protein